jgi:hypothetical protein
VTGVRRPAALAALVGSLVAGACAWRPKSVPATKPIDRAVVLTEKIDGDTKRPLSRRDDSEGPAVHVPQSAPIDINSTIEIHLRRDDLVAAAGGGSDPTAGIAIADSRRQLTAALEALDQLVSLHEVTLTAYAAVSALGDEARAGSGELERFFDRRREQATLRKATRDALYAIWAEESTEGDVVTAAFRTNDYRPLQRMVQEKLDAFERAAKQAVRRVTEDQLALRIEAFLSSADYGVDATPSAVHVDGYDLLPEGRVQRRDRLGLRLGTRERARLSELMEASSEIAAKAELVRQREASVESAFADLSSGFGQRVGALVVELDDLRERFAAHAASAPAIAADLARLWQELRTDPGLRAELEALPGTLGPELVDATAAVAELVALADELRSLQQEWNVGGVAALPRLAPRSLALFNRVEALSKRLAETNAWRDAATRLPKALERLEESLQERVTERVLASDAWKRADALAADLERARRVVLPLAALLGGVTQPPLPPIRSSGSVAVPLEEVTDTSIDLLRADRLTGDLLTIKTTLYRGETEIASSSSSLELDRFGYHASLDPSVVLTRPVHVHNGTQGFTFAPALSWLHHWSPRPEDERWFAPTMRALHPSVGLHAALLNSSVDNEVEVGLGATVGFWDGKLQFGSGYNFMNDRQDASRIYFYVGSSLIPLLQGLGFGDDRRSGQHP